MNWFLDLIGVTEQYLFIRERLKTQAELSSDIKAQLLDAKRSIRALETTLQFERDFHNQQLTELQKQMNDLSSQVNLLMLWRSMISRWSSDDATQERQEPKDCEREYQDASERGKASEASGSDCLEQSGQVEAQEEAPKVALYSCCCLGDS